MDYKKLSREERDRLLKSELTSEKIKFMEKYKLFSTGDLRWYTDKNNTPERIYFSHKFLKNNGIMEILFRKYQFCFAKLKYFRENIDKYEAFKYDPKEGFVKTEMWDAEFFKHKKSGRFIDLRYLQQITELNIFLSFVNWLEDESNG